LNIALTLVGSGLGKESLAQSLKQVLAALAVINLLAWVVMRMVKKSRKSPTN
jgi:flagellar biogenesis protein FliO